jgi:hypothetical protein
MRLQFQSHHLWMAKKLKTPESVLDWRAHCSGRAAQSLSALRHHTPLSLRSDARTAFRHATFIAVASVNLSSGEGENAFSSHSAIGAEYEEKSMRRVS